MKYKYFSCGSESEAEGLTLAANIYDDNDNFVAGFENPEKNLYKAKEITVEEYLTYQKRLKSPDSKIGMAGGLVNDVGFEKYKKKLERIKKEALEYATRENEPKIALAVKKIKKLLQLEIIEQGDVDTEIEQQGMKEFKDEIKKRLEQ